MWKAIQRGWLPEQTWKGSIISRTEYDKMKQDKNYRKPHERGFAKFAVSFGGKAWGGFFRAPMHKNKNTQGEIGNRKLREIRPKVKGVKFMNKDYIEFEPENCIIYVDPPYGGTTGYKGEKFDNQEFWRKVRDWSKKNVVFISEELHNFPKWVKIIWTKKFTQDFGGFKTMKNRERIEALGVVGA